MYKNSLASETFFEKMLVMSNKILEKQISRADFHKCMIKFGFNFSAAEIDGLFMTLDFRRDEQLDVEEW